MHKAECCKSEDERDMYESSDPILIYVSPPKSSGIKNSVHAGTNTSTIPATIAFEMLGKITLNNV